METPEQRSERGREAIQAATGGVLVTTDIDQKKGKITVGTFPSMDWHHHSEARKRLSSSQRSTFDLEFIKARAVAGVRPAVDLALAAMRAKLMQRLGKPTWRAR